MPASTLQLDPRDNALVALRDLAPGGEEGAVEPIAAKHKFAAEDLAPGDAVTLYGVLVGRTTEAVPKGGLLHTGNLSHAAESFGIDDYPGAPSWDAPDVSAWEGRTFQGYRRSDGRTGTANHWLVVPMVFCENRNLDALRSAFRKAMGDDRFSPYEDYVARLADAHRGGEDIGAVEYRESAPGSDRLFPGVDGLKFLAHEGGCGCDQGDAHALVRLLAGYIAHPNVAGATVLSLGCQHAKLELLREAIAEIDPGFDRPLVMVEEQSFRSDASFMETAIRETFCGLAEADRLVRQDSPLSELCLGMECGGSDGFSGISANPVIGTVADRIAALRGKVILSEFPELCGVERELIARCATRENAARFIDLMRRYQARAEAVGSGFDMNPSPGNIKDGLITDAIKSAGAAKKGGTSPVADVLDYTGQVRQPGLNLLCTPGNDVESTTAMAGSGANLILFSTGLGTPTGNPVCPVIKVASNHTIAEDHSDFIDFDAGGIIDGSQTLDTAADDLLELVIDTASGRPTHAVRRGQDDFIPWKRGVSL